MRISIITILFSLFGISLLAQSFNGGIKMGFTASQISGDQLSGFDKAGPLAGGWVRLNTSKKSAFDLELFYTQLGSRKNAKKEDPTTYLLRMHYIIMPLMYSYKLNQNLAIETGASFGVLADYLERDQNGESGFSDTPKFKRTDAAFNLGMRYDFTENISLNIRLHNSVLPVRDHDGGNTYRLNQGQYHTAILNSLLFKL